jgi:predicted amidophosphoribosyltransferase
MIDYFDEECLCRCCEKNIKKANQIVCNQCHQEQSKPLLLSDDEEDH